MQICQNDTFAKSTLDEIAKELNMSKRNLQRALRIERNLTDSMKELLDTGEITKTFASDTIASLSENHIIFPYHPIKTKHKFEKTCWQIQTHVLYLSPMEHKKTYPKSYKRCWQHLWSGQVFIHTHKFNAEMAKNLKRRNALVIILHNLFFLVK